VESDGCAYLTLAAAAVVVGFANPASGGQKNPTSLEARVTELEKRVVVLSKGLERTHAALRRMQQELAASPTQRAVVGSATLVDSDRTLARLRKDNGNRATIISRYMITNDHGRYVGWPSITRTRGGDLIAVFSGGRDWHICPFGLTKLTRSADDGKTWTEPALITNTPLDDRDAGILETRKGTLLISWFTHTGYADSVEQLRPGLGDKIVDGWKERIDACAPEIRRKWHGNWVRRSTDGGKTWGPPIRTHGSTPHGPIELKDGRLLYVGNTPRGEDDFAKRQKPAITAEVSCDDGLSWEIIGKITMAPEDRGGADEPSVVELPDGKLICLIRYAYDDKGQLDCRLRQCESTDGGRTWTTPRKTCIRGLPPHVVRLENGHLLVAYGFRERPYSVRACVSKDEGKTWDIDGEIILSYAHEWDLGYPASVQLDDGSILTVYYQAEILGDKCCLMATHWRLCD